MTQAVFENNIIHFPSEPMPNIDGLGTAFYYNMIQNKDDIAQIDAITGEKETYTQLHQKCVRTAIQMRAHGIESGDIITICSLNNLNSCVPYLASLFLGAKTSALDPSLSLTDTVYLVKQICPKMVFVDQAGLEVIEKALRQSGINSTIVVFDNNSKQYTSFSQFLQPSPEESTFMPVDVNIKETAIILFSSGTTGMPKGICLTHYGLLGNAYQNQFFTKRGEVALSFASIYWISTIMIIHDTIISSATRLICPRFDANEIWNWIRKYKVRAMFLAPTQLLGMCHYGRPKHADTSNLKYLIVGGGPIAAEQLDNLKGYLEGTLIFRGYSQTELSGGGLLFQCVTKQEHKRFVLEKPEACGTGVAASSYKIVDPETEEKLGVNQRGELRIKSNFLMKGYHNVDSCDCWDSEGYLKTGDIAYYDEDFCFYIVDRIKEMLKFQSWHVAPAQIESVILTHPAVENAVVIGLPHPEDGDHPMAIVMLKHKVGNSVTEEDIKKYVEERVDDRKKLRGGVKIVQSIPLTPTGKINRKNIKLMVLQEGF